MANSDVVYSENEFSTQQLTCNSCGWSGPGSEAKVIDLYGLAKAKPVTCPVCDNNLGSIVKGDGPQGETPDELGFQIG